MLEEVSPLFALNIRKFVQYSIVVQIVFVAASSPFRQSSVQSKIQYYTLSRIYWSKFDGINLYIKVDVPIKALVISYLLIYYILIMYIILMFI